MMTVATNEEIEPELRTETPRKLRLRLGVQLARVLLPTFYFGVLALLIWALRVDYVELTQPAQSGRTAQAWVAKTRAYYGRSPEQTPGR